LKPHCRSLVFNTIPSTLAGSTAFLSSEIGC